LAVDGPGQSVGVNPGVVRLDDLQFVRAEEEDAAVAPIEEVAVAFGGRTPLDVELAIAELPLGPDLAGLEDVEATVLDAGLQIARPRSAARVVAFPLLEVMAVEEDKGVGRGAGGRLARRDHRGLWPGPVVDPPGGVRQEGRVGVAQSVVARRTAVGRRTDCRHGHAQQSGRYDAVWGQDAGKQSKSSRHDRIP